MDHPFVAKRLARSIRQSGVNANGIMYALFGIMAVVLLPTLIVIGVIMFFVASVPFLFMFL